MAGDFLALVWPRGAAAELAAEVASHASALEALGWRKTATTTTSALFLRGRPGLDVRLINRDLGVIIGEVFSRGEPVSEFITGFDEAAFERLCHRLTSGHWGRYVALRWPTASQGAAAFRDPSGALDCVTWSAAGIAVVASIFPPGLPKALQPRLELDWDRVAGLVADPSRVAGALAFKGIHAVWPGGIWYDGPAGARETQVWAPSAFTAPTTLGEAQLSSELRRRVDHSVAACLSPRDGTLIEVSGGLDSAIVATTAARRADHGVKVWLNYRGSNRRSDERDYAWAVAEAGGFALCEADKPLAALDLGVWKRLLGGLRPALNASEPHRDRDVAARCEAAGVERVLTGQGGDMVFFQHPTALVVADFIRSGARPRAVLGAAHGVARWTGQSGWSVLRQAASAARRRSRQVGTPPWAMVTEACAHAAGPGDHPWLQGIDGISPGKQLQLEALVACQAFNGDSLTARSASVVHPLLSQPVVEFCLQIPTFELTRCRRDRALAREVFADRLPPVIVERQGKGEFSSHYGRVVAASLDELRPLLMDGELAKRGLLDRIRLEAALSPEQLILEGGYSGLVAAAVTEMWVSDWVSRL